MEYLNILPLDRTSLVLTLDEHNEPCAKSGEGSNHIDDVLTITARKGCKVLGTVVD